MTIGGPSRPRSPEAWAIGLSLAWAALAVAAWALLGARAIAAAAALAAILPLALIWIGAALAHGRHEWRDDQARLRREIEGLRAELRALATERRSEGARRAAPEAEGGEIDLPPPAAPPRPSMLAAPDFIRALDFPEDADDAEGFEALRHALADPPTKQLVQASQDVLTLLSQNGVYMDDLDAEPAPPALWRRFAGGVRGSGVSGLAGVRDEAALELASARMARDTIFRDVAHHFLRQFDLGLQRFVAQASEEEVAALAQTRTARAFMLLACAAGTFD